MTDSVQQPPEPTPNHLRAKMLWWFTALLIAAGIVWFLVFYFYFSYYEWTDDAYANGDLNNINSAIPGSVIAFYADNTDLVQEGQLLVQLDTTEYEAVYNRELASLASALLQVKQLYDQVDVARQSVLSQKVTLSQTRFDYNNRRKLLGTGAVSEEDFVHARDAYIAVRVALRKVRYELRVALDAVRKTIKEKHPIIEQQKGNIRQAYYNLKHCSIFAPITGYVAQRAVNVGQWVQPSTNMMAIVPPDHVWVDANYKETQITNMRIGQPAVVELDIYGSKAQYSGVVLGIASGTGSVFSIIPPQNATGNWIKIVQRLPVRISLDPEVVKKHPTRLGLSALVEVDTSNRELPMLAVAPSHKAIAATDVYNIHLEEAEKIMEAIIETELQ